MSTLEKNQLWSGITENSLDSKYEKCRNITEEIYKRINITFEIKKLEEPQSDDNSDLSDQIDSNELSNETDLFAYDKTDSISSSISDLDSKSWPKYINLNNNEETSKFRRTVPIFRPSRPKKKFRKRIKKRQQKDNKSETDGSSDEGLPLSRIVDINTMKSNDNSCDSNKSLVPVLEPTLDCSKLEQKDSFIDVEDLNVKKETAGTEEKEESKNTINPDSLVKTIDLSQEKTGQSLKHPEYSKMSPESKTILEPLNLSVLKNEQKGKSSINTDWQCCAICQMSFRGERGLRRHMSMSHIVMSEEKLNQPNAQKNVTSKSTLEETTSAICN